VIRLSTFVLHDIKNQVATLNLVLKNAERNIGNPSFQASMLSSIKSSAGALQGLIDRLAVAPRRQDMALASHLRFLQSNPENSRCRDRQNSSAQGPAWS